MHYLVLSIFLFLLGALKKKKKNIVSIFAIGFEKIRSFTLSVKKIILSKF